MPLWRELVGRKHCVVRIQAFFEYNKSREKTYRIERVDGKPFYIAGLWDIWFDIKTGMLLPTFTMITMQPNSVMAEIHDRMPAIIERREVKNWINSSCTGEQRVTWLRNSPVGSGVLKISVHKDHSK